MSEEREQVDESGIASETEETKPLAQNQEDNASQEVLEEEELTETEEFAEWADEEDLEALAKEQADRAEDHGKVEDIAPVEEQTESVVCSFRMEKW